MKIYYNDKQREASQLYNDPQYIYILAEGGARSSKTFLNCDFINRRCVTYPNSRHLICRQSKVSCRNTVWTQTLLDILTKFENYPQKTWTEDKTNTRIEWYNKSSIWAGGFDNKVHQDSVLGSEWATIFVNEVIDLGYNVFNKLISRLNAVDIPLKFIVDCNPKAPSHWVSKFFKKRIDPITGEPLPAKISDRIATIHFHPLDNKQNLSADYLEQLQQLRGKSKKRFWDGVWSEDLEGIVYHAFDRRINVVNNPIAIHSEAETFTAWDFGVSDPTFIIIGQILKLPTGDVINIIGEYTNTNKGGDFYGKYIQQHEIFKYNNLRHYGDPSGKNRDAQLKSWISVLAGHGIEVQYKTKYSIDEMIDCANNIIPRVRVCEKTCPKTVEMFENWKFPLEADGKKKIGVKPNHDIYSHPATAFYYFACNRYGTKAGKLIV